jgi:hypothetical protein
MKTALSNDEGAGQYVPLKPRHQECSFAADGVWQDDPIDHERIAGTSGNENCAESVSIETIVAEQRRVTPVGEQGV